MLERCVDGRFVRDVERAREDATAVCFEGLRGGCQFFLVAAVENDRRAGRRERARHSEAEAVGGAGDEGRFARQIEEFGQVHLFPP